MGVSDPILDIIDSELALGLDPMAMHRFGIGYDDEYQYPKEGTHIMTDRANRPPEQIADEVRAALETIHENVVVCVESHSEYWKDHLVIRTWIDREEFPKYEFVDSMMEMDWVNVSDKKIVPFFTLVSAIIDPNAPDWSYETAKRGVVPTVEGVAEWCAKNFPDPPVKWRPFVSPNLDDYYAQIRNAANTLETLGDGRGDTPNEAACRAYLVAVEGVE